MTAAGEHGDRFVGEMHLDAVAVELDLMDPTFAGGHAVDRRCQGWLDESGKWGLYADRFLLLSLKRHR
jgi:hypothetical protein